MGFFICPKYSCIYIVYNILEQNGSAQSKYLRSKAETAGMIIAETIGRNTLDIW